MLIVACCRNTYRLTSNLAIKARRVLFTSNMEAEKIHALNTFQFDEDNKLNTPIGKHAHNHHDVGKVERCKLHKFSLYETASRFYLVGGDVMDRMFRVLKIDKTIDQGELSVADDEAIYTKEEMNNLLNAVGDGNKNSGGLKLRSSTWGVLGFIRFTGEYHMLLITKRSQVAMIGGHYIYQIDGTELISLTTSSSTRFKSDRHPEEARFLGILNNIDLSKSFYFSYSYDVTNSLQSNICHEREALAQAEHDPDSVKYNEMFVWNHHLLGPATRTIRNMYDWCLPVIHGFIDQASATTKA